MATNLIALSILLGVVLLVALAVLPTVVQFWVLPWARERRQERRGMGRHQHWLQAGYGDLHLSSHEEYELRRNRRPISMPVAPAPVPPPTPQRRVMPIGSQAPFGAVGALRTDGLPASPSSSSSPSLSAFPAVPSRVAVRTPQPERLGPRPRVRFAEPPSPESPRQIV